MGLQQNLNNIQTNLLSAKTAIAQSISNKGVECSADDKLSTFAEKIDSISGGSTGGTGDKFVVPDGLKFAYSSSFDPTMFDISNVTDMSYMFYNCSRLTNLDLSTWDTSNVTDMSIMFYYCTKLTSLDLSTWDTSNVTSTSNMFDNCSGLTNLDLSTWDTSNVTDMYSMFFYCTELTSIINLSGFDTSNVTNMSSMFYNCSGLTSLDLSTWNTTKVKSMSSMFYYCSSLTSLDLSNFDTTNVTDMDNMFGNCKSLTNLQLNDLGHNQKCTELNLTSCSALTKDSILYLFNNAFDRATAGYTNAFTIKLYATTKALLSEDELAIATNKGFTVV